ncbi:MAG: signal peptidase II [Anaerolineae bacterium]|nr:signal peptidase II [Anaerolineae bacterium]
MKFRLRRWLILIVGVALALLVDQVAKQWVLANMQEGETRLLLDAVQPYLQLTRTANTGIAFGLGSGSSEIFLAISAVIIVVLLIYYGRAEVLHPLEQIGLVLVIGGALGNAIDRIRFGHVVDFVHVWIPPLGISNVSNFADHMIVIGVGLLLVASILQERRENRLKSAEVAETAPALPTE